MRKRFTTLSTALLLTLFVACSGDTASPTSSPTNTTVPEPAATTTTVPTLPPTRTPTPSPTPAASDTDAVFCEVERDGLVGFLRHDGDPRPVECSINGFVFGQLTADLNKQLSIGTFVPRCLQPHDGGRQWIVGVLCHFDAPHHTFTTDPRPPELRDQFGDGDLIPWCTFDRDAYPDYPITVGPPCIIGGEGPLRIALDDEPIESAADCTAGFTYFSLSEGALRQLLDALPVEATDDFDSSSAAITEARVSLNEPAPERVARFFAPWTDKSPIEMNARIVEALDALKGGDAEGLAALRTQIQWAIDWYSAGRGC